MRFAAVYYNYVEYSTLFLAFLYQNVYRLSEVCTFIYLYAYSIYCPIFFKGIVLHTKVIQIGNLLWPFRHNR